MDVTAFNFYSAKSDSVAQEREDYEETEESLDENEEG